MYNNFFKRFITIFFIIIFVTGIFIPFSSSISIKSKIIFENQFEPIKLDWWPMFHHDANQNGFSTSSGPDSNDVLWSYQTDNLISASPNVFNGKVYIGSSDKKFYCFDMMNGDILWNFTTKDKITGSSAIYNGKVYFGSQDTKFYCLNADNGSEIWNYNTNFMIESSPIIKDNKVFFGSSDGLLYCLNAENGSLKWKYSVGNDIWTSPAVNENRLYFGSFSGDFFCLDTTIGDLLWSYTTNGSIWSSPAFFNEKIYFGSKDDYVYCLDADNGSLLWKYDVEGDVYSSPAIAYGNVYIGASGQGLYCLNAETGELVWQFLINNGIRSSPSIADNKVFYGNDPCCGTPAYFFCSDAFTGDMIWQYNIGGDIGMKSSPAIAAGKVFIGAANGMVFAFGGNELYADAHGPYSCFINKPIQFNGSAYGGKPDFLWHWDFGNGETSNEQNPIYSYSIKGDYIVTLTVIDENNNVAIDETSAEIEEHINYPPMTPNIEGPINGKIGEEYTYCILDIIDPNGDNVFILWDWGDGTNSNWIGPFKNGEQVCEKYIWNKKGSYIVKAKLKDEHNQESEWGYLKVVIPKHKINKNILLLKLIEQFLNSHKIFKQLLSL